MRSLMVFSEFHSNIEGPFRPEFNARLFLSKNEKMMLQKWRSSIEQ
jgi:hypothetical protein